MREGWFMMETGRWPVYGEVYVGGWMIRQCASRGLFSDGYGLLTGYDSTAHGN
jgi:hypothetical protein